MRNTIIILGAPRSGTNMLRDALTSLDGVETWPCDEINYIWRHRNVRYPTDELPEERATPRVAKYIRGRFDSMWRSTGAATLVEKTCANCLRVPFVNRVLPDARYVYIHRDGVDAVGSSLLRWHAPLDIPYVAAKARFIPPSDVAYYAARYLGIRLRRLVAADGRLASWGPVIEDMGRILKEHTLSEVCALQWQRCVELAEAGLGRIDERNVVRVRYEDFVGDPRAQLGRVAEALHIDATGSEVERAVARVSASSIGKGRSALGPEECRNLEALVGTSLARYGYIQSGRG